MPDTNRRDEGDRRGRQATTPTEIPPIGWKDVLVRAYKASSRNNISIVAAGLTYYMLLALFPALIVLVSLYGLVSNPAEVQQQMQAISSAIPGGAQQVVGTELHQIAASSGQALSFGVVIGFLMSLYSASRGMSGMIIALNIAYDQQETRSFIRRMVVSLGLTAVLVVVAVLALVLVAGAPVIVAAIGMGATVKWLTLLLEWPLLLVVVMAVLAVLYRYAPDRKQAQWRWTSPGAVIATLLWIVGSVLFTLYVANFGSYNKTYGSLGALIGMLTWMYLSAYVVLLGAEINEQTERQTQHDSTVGKAEPMGRRGATAADTLGETTGSR